MHMQRERGVLCMGTVSTSGIKWKSAPTVDSSPWTHLISNTIFVILQRETCTPKIRETDFPRKGRAELHCTNKLRSTCVILWSAITIWAALPTKCMRERLTIHLNVFIIIFLSINIICNIFFNIYLIILYFIF